MRIVWLKMHLVLFKANYSMDHAQRAPDRPNPISSAKLNTKWPSRGMFGEPSTSRKSESLTFGGPPPFLPHQAALFEDLVFERHLSITVRRIRYPDCLDAPLFEGFWVY